MMVELAAAARPFYRLLLTQLLAEAMLITPYPASCAAATESDSVLHLSCPAVHAHRPAGSWCSLNTRGQPLQPIAFVALILRPLTLSPRDDHSH